MSLPEICGNLGMNEVSAHITQDGFSVFFADFFKAEFGCFADVCERIFHCVSLTVASFKSWIGNEITASCFFLQNHGKDCLLISDCPAESLFHGAIVSSPVLLHKHRIQLSPSATADWSKEFCERVFIQFVSVLKGYGDRLNEYTKSKTGSCQYD